MNSTKKLLRLDSMTLRGIGSYYRGAELKFRPLTILCGTNGSGKSTWFNRIAMLQRSLQRGKLPFDFDASDGSCHDLQNTNSQLSGALLDEVIGDLDDDDRYGPLGTIGLSSTAVIEGLLFEGEEFQNLPGSNRPCSRLLRFGECVKDMKFRLRLAHSSDGMVEYHQDLIELVLDSAYVIRMTRPCKDHGNPDLTSPRYTLECSRGYFSAEGGSGDEVVPILRFHPRDNEGRPWGIEPLVVAGLPPANAEAILSACIGLICGVVDNALRGFFPITAIRDRQDLPDLEPSFAEGSLDELINELKKPKEDRTRSGTTEQLLEIIRDRVNRIVDEERVNLRYVGSHGEASFRLWRTFAANKMYDPLVPAGYTVDAFLSFWLNKLLCVQTEEGRGAAAAFQFAPVRGWLRNSRPDSVEDDASQHDPESLCRFSHPCFGTLLSPSRLSSGFHQLMPMILQSALLMRGEILAIENPEVHLHPSLQLGTAEFLMQQALGGKTIVVETHSDLIIRRLIRAVLEEDIKQEALNIQFVALKADGTGSSYSVLQPLRINDRDQIENWPSGFMDDDLKESRRLFNIMYGTTCDEDEEKST